MKLVYIPIVLLGVLICIETLHVYQHSNYCKTETEWRKNQR